MGYIEPIVICLLTFQRTQYALRTIAAARTNLRYPDIRWYVADDGSSQEHVEAVKSALHGAHVIGGHTFPGTYGSNANRAWNEAQNHSKLTLWLEDDWELRTPLDLTRYATLLEQRNGQNGEPAIGMVRMGYLNTGMRGVCFGENHNLYWLLDRDASSYVFTGHPSLRHQRYRDAYGLYPEGIDPGKTELGYAMQYRYPAYIERPEIVFPVALGEYGPFHHIGQEQSYTP